MAGMSFPASAHAPAPISAEGGTRVLSFDGLLAFVAAHWDETVRIATRDEGQIVGLPRPYTVPCRKEHFQELYYWDTFYTNEGLLAQGRVELARDNVDNLLHLLRRFGFVPNGNRTYYLGRSQPPHLALMVERVFEATGDLAWLDAALGPLEREWGFWQARRCAPCGLNHYGHHEREEELLAMWGRPDPRGVRPPEPADDAGRIREAGHHCAECESGWDFTPRFKGRAMDFCPVDLNALLWASERVLARGHARLGRAEESALWHERARARATRMRELLWDAGPGAFCDYDHVGARRSPLVSAAMVYPVWLGLADSRESDAILRLLPRLERAAGVLACEPGPRARTVQWDAPNAWPPLQYAVVGALRAAGREADAARVAEAFLVAVERARERTDDLWEKYDAETGAPSRSNEYGLPAMMGWTAGVCAALAPGVSKTS